MKTFKKITAILCAAVLAGGVCAACACGGNPLSEGGDEPERFKKPSIPQGVEKVEDDKARETVAGFWEKFVNSENVKFEGYSKLEDTSSYSYATLEGEDHSFERGEKSERSATRKTLKTAEGWLGDCDYAKSEEYIDKSTGEADRDHNYESNVKRDDEIRLRGDTATAKYTGGTKTTVVDGTETTEDMPKDLYYYCKNNNKFG